MDAEDDVDSSQRSSLHLGHDPGPAEATAAAEHASAPTQASSAIDAAADAAMVLAAAFSASAAADKTVTTAADAQGPDCLHTDPSQATNLEHQQQQQSQQQHHPHFQQQKPQQQRAASATDQGHFVHAFFPQKLTQVPVLRVTYAQPAQRQHSNRWPYHRQQQQEDDEILLLLERPMQQLDPSGPCDLSHWVCGPVEPPHQTAGSRGHFEATVTAGLPKAGIFSRSKPYEAKRRLLPDCRHHFVLDPKLLTSKQILQEGTSTGGTPVAAALLAAVVQQLLQQLQLQQPDQLPSVLQQLKDLCQYSILQQQLEGDAASAAVAGTSNCGRGDTAGSAATVLSVIVLLAQQLPGVELQTAAADHNAGVAAPGTAYGAVAAWLALLMLSNLRAAEVQQHSRSLTEHDQLQLNQSMAILLQQLAQLADAPQAKATAGAASAAAGDDDHSWQRPSKRSRDVIDPDSDTSKLASADQNLSGSSSSGAGRIGQSEWLAPLRKALSRTTSASAVGCALAASDLLGMAWLEAVPALYTMLREPSLGFLWGALEQLRRQKQQQQYSGSITTSSKLDQFVSVTSQLYSRLERINSHITCNAQLLDAVIVLVPGLPGLMHLMQLPQLVQHRRQAFGAAAGVDWQLNAAVEAAMKGSTILDLLQCWATMSDVHQARFKAQTQRAVLASLLRDDQPVDSSSHPATDLILSELLYGSLFEGPQQLLQGLMQTCSRSTTHWPELVAYRLVPAALQQLLEQQAHKSCDSGHQALADMQGQEESADARIPETAHGTSTRSHAQSSPAERQQYQQQQRQEAHWDDILNLVKQWLQHIDHTAAGVGPATGDASVSSISTRSSPLLQLFCAAEALLRNCTTDGWGIDALQQVMQGTTDIQSVLYQPTAPGGQVSRPNLLQCMLHVISERLQEALQGLQFASVFCIAGPLAKSGCCMALQQLFLRQLAPLSAAAYSAASEQHSLPTSITAGRTGASSLTTTNSHSTGRLYAELNSRMSSTWESADLLVSAVLGCQPGVPGLSSLWSSHHTSGSLARHTGGSAGNSPHAWQTVRGRQKRRKEAHAAEQPEADAGDSQKVATWLQEQVLLLLADNLLQPRQPEPAANSQQYSATACSSKGTSCLTLVQDTNDLLVGHPLWLKLLVANSCPPPEHNSTATGTSSRLNQHAAMQQVGRLASDLCHNVIMWRFPIGQLQQLQYQQQALSMFAVAAQQHSLPTDDIAVSLQQAAAALQQANTQQRVLGDWYTILCPMLGGTADLDSYIANLQQAGSQLHSYLAADLNTSSLWGRHAAVLHAAELVAPILHTTPFSNSVHLYRKNLAVATASATAEPGVVAAQQVVTPDDLVDWSTSGLPVSSDGNTSITVVETCDMLPAVIRDFASRWTAATRAASPPSSQRRLQDPTVADVLALWVSDALPSSETVAAHQQQIEDYLKAQQPSSVNSSDRTGHTSPVVVPPAAVSALLRLYHSSREYVWSDQLAELQEVFELQTSPLLQAMQQLPSASMLELQAPAVLLADAFTEIEEQLGVLARHHQLLVQLGKSAGLQEFLATTGSDDLRRLTDGAEDQGDGFLRSPVVSDLLEVNRLLQQLRDLHGAATLEQLLQRIVDVATSNARQAVMHSTKSGVGAGQAVGPTSAAAGHDTSRVPDAAVDAACSRLTVQLRSCIEYLHGFKALYNRLANRAELTREVVASVMQRGMYQFETRPHAAGASANINSSVVMAYCSYPPAHASSAQSSNAAAAASTVSDRRLSIPDLVELRSRVMLLTSSSCNQPQNSNAAGDDMLALFVQEVGIVAEITTVVKQLLDVGCYGYSSWEQQLSATQTMQQRSEQLQQLQQQLQQDLEAWKQQLTIAQAKCRWLNYFEPRQLFIIRDFLSSDLATDDDDVVIVDSDRDLSAMALLQFVQPALQLLQVEAVMAAAAQCASSMSASTAAFAVAPTGSPALRVAVRALYQLQQVLDVMFSQQPPAVGCAAMDLIAHSVTASAAPAAAADSSSISVIVTDKKARSVAALLQARDSSIHQALQPSDVVFCSGTTSWWQVQLLLQRCFPWLAWHAAGLSMDADGASTMDAQQSNSVRLHALCDVDKLPLELQNSILQLLQLVAGGSGSATDPQHNQLLLISSNSSCLLVSSLLQAAAVAELEGGSRSAGQAIEVAKSQHVADSTAAAASLSVHMQQQECSAVILTSDLPGQSKSTTSAKLATAQGKQLYHVLLVDDMSPPCDVISQLRAWKPQQEVLHLQLLKCSSPATVEQVLYSLLVLGHLSNDSAVYHRPPGPCSVIIEVGNSLAENLLQQLPLLAAADQQQGLQLLQHSSTSAAAALASGSGELLKPGYRRLHCTFNPAHVDTSSPDMQLLSVYLSLNGAGILDQISVGVNGEVAQQYHQYVPSAAASQQLLQQAFISGRESVMSYTLVNTFVSVAARQLRHMSGSCFFLPETLQYAFGGAGSTVRSQLLQAITAAAASFSVESCSAVRNRQHQQQQFGASSADAGLQLAARMGSVIGWSESNHLLLLFNSADDHQTITPLYRLRQHVPASFQQLLATQVLRSDGQRGGLLDYGALKHYQLLQVLLQLVQQPGRGNVHDSSSWDASLVSAPYILTADNLLKMALIYMRSQCGLPVVMMGDTGCGKTSLLKFLANAAGVGLQVLNVHAGTSSLDLLQAVHIAEAEATNGGRQVWLFFDESNTCEHQGLLASIISHRQLPGGRQLHPNVIPMTAVNPYRLKPTLTSAGASTIVATAGLRSKLPAAHTGLGRLVYSVQPSPEALLDHVCDYGTLSKTDEAAYIKAMVAQAADCGSDGRSALPEQLFVDLLCASQNHTRSCGYDWDVSLRDVSRCLRLARWFEGNMRNRPKPKRTWQGVLGSYCNRYLLLSEEQQEQASEQRERANAQRQALVLALMHTYLSRLSSREDRQQYLQLLVAAFRAHDKSTTVRRLLKILEMEQQDYLKRMELPAGIAVNEALQENVFTALVCILNKIPLFLVGKPGSSKSLALRLIHANLRGPDSSDDFFRQLPALLFYSYQGSESSTSEGIHKVFGEAKKAATAAGSGTIVVVLLDEVGLAEISPHNPLKALHALLEPGYPAQLPDVAVVGISNWALDAAKMSRAVVLSRPEPELDDLMSTAVTIWQDAYNTAPDAAKRHTLQEVAKAYHHHYHNQTVQDFHGLRDYYALIKTLRLQPQLSPEQLYRALSRNFGGPAELVQQVMASFSQHVVRPPCACLPTVDELIKDNLLDHTARHLLLISTGDLAVDVVQSCLADTTLGQASTRQGQAPGHQVVVLWGSPWPDDQSEAYKYSVLSEIILRMELGHKLILRDCGIFGALYDMLNQNYSTVGGRSNCRIALGPHSNPMCTVHEDFKAVVVMDPAQATAADPSLLNRFEKQWLDCRHLLPVSYQKLLLEPLEHWVQQLSAAAAGSSAAATPSVASSTSSISNDRAAFTAQDLFLGHTADSLASLLVRYRNQQMRQQPAHTVADLQTQQWLMDQCQQELLAVCSLDGVARACCSTAGSSLAAPVRQLVTSYLQAPVRSIADFVVRETMLMQQPQPQQDLDDAAGSSSGTGPAADVSLWYVMTRSGLHVTVSTLLRDVAGVRELFVSQIKSEKELRHQLQSFLAMPPPSQLTNEQSSNHASAERLQLLVIHATEESAAELRHFRHLVVECVTSAGLRPATVHGATAASSAASADCTDCIEAMQLDEDVLGEQTHPRCNDVSQAPLLAVMVVVHLPTATAAAHAAARLPAAAPLPVAGLSGSAATASNQEHSWQCSWLSVWHQVTVDSLEGYKPWVLEVLRHCMAAATVQDSAKAGRGVASAAAAMPLQQLMSIALVEAFSALPYPRTAAAAERVKCISAQLLSTEGSGLWGMLQQLVQDRLEAWPGWRQHRLLQLAGDVLQLQLHGSYPAAVEAALNEEVRVQLTHLLLGLEQNHVLDAYLQATDDVKQMVLSLLRDGQLAPKDPQHTTLHALQSALQLQLPVSKWCYQRLQAIRTDCTQLLQCPVEKQTLQAHPAGVSEEHDQDVEMGDVSDEMQAAGSDSRGSAPTHSPAEYQLDTLLIAAVGESMAVLLKHHATAFSSDMLLLMLADEAEGTTGNVVLPEGLAGQLLQLISGSCSQHHPLQVQLLAWQHQPQLRAFAQVLSLCRCSDHSLGMHESAQGSNCQVVDRLVVSLYRAQLPTRANMEAVGGIAAWHCSCRAAVAQGQALLPLGLDSSSLVLLENLEALMRLVDTAEGGAASSAAAAGVSSTDLSHLLQPLGLLSIMLLDGRQATTSVLVLGKLLEVVSQLPGSAAAAASLPAAGQAQLDRSAYASTSYKSWLLSRSVRAIAAEPSLLSATSAGANTAPETDKLPTSPLQLVARQLLNGNCTAGMLQPMVQLLQLSPYYQQGWRLLEDVQLLGQQYTTCPVLHSIHKALTGSSCADSAAVALVSFAIQQCYFTCSSFIGSQQAAGGTNVMVFAEQEAVKAANWVNKAANLLCQGSLPALQLAVVVAFLRSVTDACAPAAAALAAPASASGKKTQQQAVAAAKACTPVLSALNTILVDAARHTRLHSLFMYLLKALKGLQSVGQLQQMITRIGQQADHPLNQCMAALSARLPATTQDQQLQHQLPPDPYTGMPQYQQLTQLLLEAAAFPESAPELLRSSLQKACNDREVAKAWLAVLCRQVHLPRGCVSSSHRSSSGAAGGLAEVVKQLPSLLKESLSNPPIQQLMLALIQDSWCHTGSTGSSSRNRQQQQQQHSLLQLTAGASEQQLYIASAMVHLAIALTACRTAGQDSAAGPSASAAAAALGTANLAAAFLTYLTDPAAAKGQYMLGMPGDEAAQLLNMPGLGGTSVYRCACGMAYLIGNCGNPAESAKCPSVNCTYNIGNALGQVRVAQAGQVQQNQQAGFISTLVSIAGASSKRSASKNDPALAAAASSGVRDLHPSSCHLLRLLVHAALAIGAAAGLQPKRSLCSLVQVADESAAQQLVEAVVVQQWQLLRKSMQATEEQVLAAVLCSIDTLTSAASRASSKVFDLSSTSGRQQLEGLFQQQVAAQWTRSPNTALQHLLAARQTADNSSNTTSQTYLACAVQEGLVRGDNSEHNSKHLLTLFRSIGVPTLDALAAQFWSEPENVARYPVIHAVLLEQQQQQMRLLPHLLHLVEFEAVIRQSFSHTVDQAAARSLTLSNQLEQVTRPGVSQDAAADDRPAEGAANGSRTSTQPSTHSSSSKKAPTPADQLQQFIESWNTVCQITTRLECRDIAVPELSPASASVAFACLTGRDEGMYLLAMLTELVNRHNAFLRLAAQQQQQQVAEASQEPLQSLRTKGVQFVKRSDIIDVSAAVQHLQDLLAMPGCGGLAYPGLEYGQPLRFDLAAVEQLLHRQLVTGKCLLDASTDSLQQFVFKGEVFKRSALLLHETDSKVPQLPPSLAASSELAAALQHQLPAGQTAASVLPHLEVLMSFMVQTGGSTSSSVASYAAAWLPEGPTRAFLTGSSFMQQLRLQQVVGLYEGLEDAIAAAVAIEDCCSGLYRQPLDPQLQREVSKVVGAQASASSRSSADSSSKLPRRSASSTIAQGPRHQLKQAAIAASIDRIPAPVMVSMLRRVILRFLCGAKESAPDQAVQPEVTLSVYCCNFDCCRWPWSDMGCADRQTAEQLVEQVFPDGLQLAHVASVVVLLQ